MRSNSGRRLFTGADAWERIGITEHLGGIYATHELISLCGIKPGQLVLDIGCGTGYTACLLAKEYGVRVVAADINAGLLALAERRVIETGVGDRVALALADVQHLPFSPNSFDAAIAESVLIFCAEVQAASEVYTALRPGGVFGDNELTFLRPPPNWLRTALASAASGVGISPRFEGQLEGQWKSVYGQAGFKELSSLVRKISLWQQLASHLRIDGAKKYFASTLRVALDPDLRAFLFEKDILRSVVQARSYIGFGLYTSRKVGDPSESEGARDFRNAMEQGQFDSTMKPQLRFEEPHAATQDSYRDLVREFVARGKRLVPFPLAFPNEDFPAFLARLAACHESNLRT